MRIRIISGGQTGVDRAIIDAAIKAGIEYRGHIPRSGAEDMPAEDLMEKYPDLEATKTDNRDVRTVINVFDAEAVLTVFPGSVESSPGTTLGCELAQELNKPNYYAKTLQDSELKRIALWLQKNFNSNEDIIELAVGGPRESEWDGAYEKSLEFFNKLFELLKNY